MTTKRSLASTIHDAIDEVTTAVEDIHRSIAEVPLDILVGIEPIEGGVENAKEIQSRSIAAVYGAIRMVNARVRELTTGDPGAANA